MVQIFYQNLKRGVVTAVLLGAGFSPAVFGQKLLNTDIPVKGNCLSEASASMPGQGGLTCDHRAIAELARPGHAFGENQIGIESALVLGPDRTLPDARKWFEKAAAQGYVPAQINLAVCYLNSWGTAQNYGAALYWLRTAAEKGDPRAHTNLGILYLKGWGVKRDYDEALRNFRVAAERDDTGAMVDLGFMSDGGLGTPKDQDAAAAWYRQAAERGDALGQNNLADLYLRGEGVLQSNALALAWFEKAAAQGQTGARIKLGFMYMTGRGVQKDPEMAYAWILAASLAGDQRGDEYIPALKAALNPEQIARATQRAKELQSVPGTALTEVAFVR